MPFSAVLAPLAIAVAFQAVTTFANLSATTLAPRITADFGLPGGAANGYVVALYTTATIASFAAAGFVMRNGPIRASQWALLLYVVGASAAFLAPSPASILLCAVLFGAAYTMPIPTGAQILVTNTPPEMRNTLFGIRQMGVPLGGLAAGLLYPPIADAFGWRWAFLAIAGTLLALALVMQANRARYDRDRAPATPLFSSGGHGPLAVIRDTPGMKRLCFAGLLFAGTEVTAVANIVLFLTRSLDWSLVHAGYALGALSLGGALGRLFWGVVADKLKDRSLLLGCLGLAMAGSMAALAYLSADAAIFAFVSAFAVGFTAGGWTGVGVAESARLSAKAGAVAGTAALTQVMFLGIVALPTLAGLALALGVDYADILAAVGATAGFGGLLFLLPSRDRRPDATPAEQGIPWTPLILMMLTQAAATMAAYTLSTASPFIAPDLGVENEDVAQLVALVYLLGAVSATLIPPVIRKHGGIAISIAICGATVAMLSIASTAASIGMLALGALSLGCLYGATAPSSSFVLAPLAPPHRRNFVFSIRQIGVPLGGILGGILVPPLILIGGWRIAFEAQLVLTLLLILALYLVRHRYDRSREPAVRVFSFSAPKRLLLLLRDLPELRPLAIASFIYSGAQLCFGAFLVTQVVRVFGDSAYGFASAVALVAFQLSGIGARILLGFVADAWLSARLLLAVQGVIMAGAAVVAANYGAEWPLWLVLANCAVAGATASGYTGLAFAEFARIGGAERTAEATGLGAALMFFGVAVMAPLFRLGIDIFDGYAVPYYAIAGLTLICALLLLMPGPRSR